jgi:hypothetical protein
MNEIPIKRRRQLTVRMTDYENRRLEVLRRHRLPAGARPRAAGPCMVEAVLRVASALEREPELPPDEREAEGAGSRTQKNSAPSR